MSPDGQTLAETAARPGLRPEERRLLIRCVGDFADVVIEQAQGSWLTAAGGRRILAFTWAARGAHLRAGLIELQQRHEQVGDVRGEGLLLGVDLVTDRASRTPAPACGTRVTERCFELGLNVNIVKFPALGSILRLAPPLTITERDLDIGREILDRALAGARG